MVKEIQYVSINRVIDELMRHPMLRDLTLEQAVSYTVSFIGIQGLPKMYEDKCMEVEIHEFRGLLPCDLISIIQVKDKHTGICLRSMTDNFLPHKHPHLLPHPKKEMEQEFCPAGAYIPPMRKYFEEPAFKTQGRVIFTSFPEGVVEVAYKAIPVDDEGFPLLMDNEAYLAALKAYIKQEMFTIKFDMGDLAAPVLQNAKQEYCWACARLNSELTIPSVSEMESLARMWNTMIPKMREFSDGFKHLGDREWIRRH